VKVYTLVINATDRTCVLGVFTAPEAAKAAAVVDYGHALAWDTDVTEDVAGIHDVWFALPTEDVQYMIDECVVRS
jgi:hypothetical protein